MIRVGILDAVPEALTVNVADAPVTVSLPILLDVVGIYWWDTIKRARHTVLDR